MKTKACTKCGTALRYDEGYDAYYCHECDEWAETKCDDPKCFYCIGRPDKPSKAIDEVYL